MSKASTKHADIKDMSFERALKELETIVARLERGDVELEESITIYERGEALRDHCDRLAEAGGGQGREAHHRQRRDAARAPSRSIEARGMCDPCANSPARAGPVSANFRTLRQKAAFSGNEFVL